MFNWPLNSHPESEIQAYTCEDEHTVYCTTAHLVSLIRLDGYYSLRGAPELNNTLENWHQFLAPYLDRQELDIEVCYESDPDQARQAIRANLAPARMRAKQLRLDMQDIIDERQAALEADAVQESVIIVIRTKPVLGTKKEAKEVGEDHSKDRLGVPYGRDSQQPPGMTHEKILERHNLIVSGFLSVMKQTGHRAKKLHVDEAFKVWVAQMYGLDEAANCQFKSGFAPYQHRSSKLSTAENDHSAKLPPSISHQLLRKHIEPISRRIIKVGDRLITTAVIDAMPDNPQIIEKLLRELKTEKIGYRINFKIKPQGIKYLPVNSTIAQFIGFLPGNIGAIKAAYDALQDHRKRGGCIVGLSAVISVWVNAGEKFDKVKRVTYYDTGALNKRFSRLLGRLQSWGNATTSEAVPNCLDAYISSCSGLTGRSVAPITPTCLNESLTMLPLMRPSSPFPQGITQLITDDGKILPFEWMSKKQNSWVNIYVGPQGYGKSNTMAIGKLDFLLQPTANGDMPLIKVLDIGQTQRGFVEMVKASLPSDMQHLAVYEDYLNLKQYASNPCDPHVGQRFLTIEQTEYLENFCKILLTDITGSKQLPPTFNTLLSSIIKHTYTKLSDDGQPKRYTKEVNRLIDAALESNHIETTKDMSWFSVCDRLAEAGDFVNAKRATQLAAPLISDIARSCADSVIGEDNPEEYNGTKLTKLISRLLLGAVDEYPTLSSPTRIDFSQSRVTVLDVTSLISKSEDKYRQRANAIHYMQVMNLLTRDDVTTEVSIRSQIVGKIYKDHLIRHRRSIEGTAKLMANDEWHLFRTVPNAEAAKGAADRVARKSGWQIDSASQGINDYSEELRNFSSTIFYLGISSKKDAIKEAVELVGLSETETSVLTSIKKPTSKGAEMMISIETGEHKQLSIYGRMKAGPIVLWAISSVAEDLSLKKVVYERCGGKKGRELLAKRFPGGSCAEEVASMLRQLGSEAEGEEGMGVLEFLADQVCGQVHGLSIEDENGQK